VVGEGDFVKKIDGEIGLDIFAHTNGGSVVCSFFNVIWNLHREIFERKLPTEPSGFEQSELSRWFAQSAGCEPSAKNFS